MLRRTPVALWWLLGLLLLGVAVVPLLGADAEAEQAQEEAQRAERWVGTTSVVTGTFAELRDVRVVEPRVYRADVVYDVALSDGSSAEVLVPERRAHAWPRADQQPPRLLLRIRGVPEQSLTADGPHYAVQAGRDLASAQATADVRARQAGAAIARADQVRRWTVLVAVVVVVACAVATAAAYRPGRPGGWFAGSRAPGEESDPDALQRAAVSAELPVGMALLGGLVVVVPLGTQPVSLLVLAGLVALGACALLAREHEAVARARDAHVARWSAHLVGVRRRAVALRSVAALGVLAGLVLMAIGDTGDDHRSQGAAVLVLSVLTLLTLVWRRGGPSTAREPVHG